MSSNKVNYIIQMGICLLCWMSFVVDFGLFFPLAAFFIYKKDSIIRQNAVSSVLFQFFFYLFFAPLKLSTYFFSDFEAFLSEWLSFYAFEVKITLLASGLVVLLCQNYYLKRKFQYHNLKRLVRKQYKKKYKLFSVFYLLSFLFLSSILTDELILTDNFEITFNPASNLESNVLNFFSFVFVSIFILGNKRSFVLFRKPLLISAKHLRAKKSHSFYYNKRYNYAKLRNFFIPGWGNVYLKPSLSGFFLIFSYLLFLFLFLTVFFSYIDFIFGIRFLGSFGLKSTFNQQFLSEILSSIYPLLFFLICILTIYVIAYSSLNEKTRNKDSNFFSNFHYSMLFHLILFCLLFLVPFSIRTPPKAEPISSNSKPLNFYFIDDYVSSSFKGLNGGVVVGNSDKVASNSKKVEGKNQDSFTSSQKKLGNEFYQTYSSYISAKMRGPELFMQYWKKAPENYSCVVSYTINSNGDVLEAYIVESSNYPEQDQLTLDLIYSLSPLISPPTTNKTIRVTELFWNGEVDSESMPTALQQQLVLSFDGRFIEEL